MRPIVVLAGQTPPQVPLYLASVALAASAVVMSGMARLDATSRTRLQNLVLVIAAAFVLLTMVTGLASR